jgi:hypothetical protein
MIASIRLVDRAVALQGRAVQQVTGGDACMGDVFMSTAGGESSLRAIESRPATHE